MKSSLDNQISNSTPPDAQEKPPGTNINSQAIWKISRGSREQPDTRCWSRFRLRKTQILPKLLMSL